MQAVTLQIWSSRHIYFIAEPQCSHFLVSSIKEKMEKDIGTEMLKVAKDIEFFMFLDNFEKAMDPGYDGKHELKVDELLKKYNVLFIASRCQ